MNKALRKHMLKTVQGFTAVSSDSENRLLELMHAVPRGGYNATAPSDAGKTQKLLKDFKNNWKSQFYLGPALSGAPFHNHGPAFNVLVHGKKEWTLMPPGEDRSDFIFGFCQSFHLCCCLCTCRSRFVFQSAPGGVAA